MEADELNQIQFNLNKENGELRERVEDLALQNEQLLARLNEQDFIVKEHVGRQRELEQARNELVNKNVELESRISRLQIEKEELEAATSVARKTAQTVLVETHAFKDQLRELTEQKVRLTQSLDAARQDHQSIEQERLKLTAERNSFEESKKWLMGELIERENRVSMLRLELNNKELIGASEKLQNESRVNLLNVHIERLNERVEVLQMSNLEVQKKMEKLEEVKSKEISNLEEEKKCLQELQKILKNSLEEAKNAADHFKDQLDAQEGVIAEVRTVLRENQEELREKDEEITRTRAELEQSNASDEEPLLTQTARRLAASEQDNASLRAAIAELVEVVNQSRPSALKDVELERDVARRELEKCQQDIELVTRRNTELMYALERQNRINDPNWSEQDDERLFVRCGTLLRRNLELETGIENTVRAAINAQHLEITQLRTELEQARSTERELRTTLEQITSAFESLKVRAEHFKELVRDTASASQARLARLKAEEAVAARLVADATVHRLREQLEEHTEECKRRELELEERCRAHEASISGAEETSVRLAAMLDAQKENTTAMELEYKGAVREKEQLNEELRKAIQLSREQEKKLLELGRQSVEDAEQANVFELSVRDLEQELQDAKSKIEELSTKSKTLKTSLEQEEQLRMSVIEMSKILEKIEAEKAANLSTQLEMLQQERDSHKATVNRLHDQLTRSRNDSRLAEQKLQKELEKYQNQMKEQERELAELREKLPVLIDASQIAPDQRELLHLKNRTQELEKELNCSTAHYQQLEQNWKATERLGVRERERLQATLKFVEQNAEEVTEELTRAWNELNELQGKYDDLLSKTDREHAELRSELQIAALNANGLKLELEQSKSRLTMAQNEQKESSKNLEHDQIVSELKQQILELQSSNQRLQKELEKKSSELTAENNGKKEAEQEIEHISVKLQRKRHELEKLERGELDRQKKHEEKLAELTRQYIELSTVIIKPQLGFHTLIQSYRETKRELIERTRLAELETFRFRDEVRDLEDDKNDLFEKIRELQHGKVVDNAVIIEKAHLIEKVGSMTSVHKYNGDLQEQIAELQEQVKQLRKRRSSAPAPLAKRSEEEKAELTMKLSQTRNLAIKYRDELAELKKSIKASEQLAEQLAEKDARIVELQQRLAEHKKDGSEPRARESSSELSIPAEHLEQIVSDEDEDEEEQDETIRQAGEVDESEEVHMEDDAPEPEPISDRAEDEAAPNGAQPEQQN